MLCRIIDVNVALPVLLNVTLQQLRCGAAPLLFIDVCLGIPEYPNLLVLSILLSNQRKVGLASVRLPLKWLDGCFINSASKGNLKNSKESLVVITIEWMRVGQPLGLFSLNGYSIR